MDAGLFASEVVVGVHGGTGIDKVKMTPDLEKRIRAGLTAAVQAGFESLRKNPASSLSAVEAAVRVLEDAPEFNAGRGAVFNHDGVNELDAAIMEGREKKAGAIAGVTHVKNPISAARAVMEQSQHVFMIGLGAETFVKSRQIELVESKYFWTQERWNELQEAKAKEEIERAKNPRQAHYFFSPPKKWGTVGAVALDATGTVAAATSTGGMTNKRFGRVGDSPVLGCGTYADNASGAVSATGHGEYFIRYAVAHEILALVKYKGLRISEAAEEVVNGQLKKAGGEGAVIALDCHGGFAMARNCEALYRAYAKRDGSVHVYIYET